ncbi:WD40-repeat-containing domain protein [Mycena maculata]|uniref:WD40-repeat-containing domain protein n=1 Tax=Mycena maculata TaxID=230809 RepID=A0AAD7IK50_9AGAR|nr:WD40-repeat-containing domain protein [Mycena maculata]
MRFPDSEQAEDSPATNDAVAGPSSVGLDHPGPSNGHMNGNGFAAIANGSAVANGAGNGVQKHNGHSKQSSAASHSLSVARVTLPGSNLYDDSDVDRQEFVRLVVQSLRDVGYIESAATLEAESGYAMETQEVADFRRFILEARWSKAENALQRLGVQDREGLWDARFLISQQKYLELLEAQKTTDALQVLRNELAPLDVDPDQLHILSSLMMCSEPEDLRQRAGWDGAAGNSRRILLDNLHRYIPPSVMIPPRRFSTLLHQANAYQRQQCVYHNIPTSSSGFSLFADHECDKTGFPRVTTTILEVHTDQVWLVDWSRDGNFLASTSSDKSVIIWGIGPETEMPVREWEKRHVLNHPYPVISLAWSLDDAILVTGAETHIMMWNTKTGVCIRKIDDHSEPVTALAWLPDDSGFLSAGLDFRIVLWNTEGQRREDWATLPVRITQMVVTPDFTRLVAIGMTSPLPVDQRGENDSATPGTNGAAASIAPPKEQHRLLVYDMASRRNESSILFEGELTSLSVSQNSQYALISRSPDDIQLWDLNLGRLVRKYTGQRQSKYIIRSCFGGFESNFVVSGSEDGNVYVWHRDTGVLLEVLEGHGEGSVNCVAWNPCNERMFASCSDDRTIRIWEAPPSDMIFDSPVVADYPPTAAKGKGKTRQRWDGDGADASGSSSTRT